MKFARYLMIALSPLAMAAAFLLTGSAQASPSPAAQICGAFQTWNHSRTLANANAMLTGVMRSPWVKYVSSDATGLYADFREGPAGAKYVVKDIKYMTEDCLT